MCGSITEASPGIFAICLQPKGHSGPHQTDDGGVMWKDAPDTPEASAAERAAPTMGAQRNDSSSSLPVRQRIEQAKLELLSAAEAMANDTAGVLEAERYDDAVDALVREAKREALIILREKKRTMAFVAGQWTDAVTVADLDKLLSSLTDRETTR